MYFTHPGRWCCRTRPPRCGRRCKTPGARRRSPGTGWTRPGGRRPGSRAPQRCGAPWRWGGCHPAAPQSRTAKEQNIMADSQRDADDDRYLSLVKSAAAEKRVQKAPIYLFHSPRWELWTRLLQVIPLSWSALPQNEAKHRPSKVWQLREIFKSNKCCFCCCYFPSDICLLHKSVVQGRVCSDGADLDPSGLEWAKKIKWKIPK